jgi:hypothetical protein
METGSIYSPLPPSKFVHQLNANNSHGSIRALFIPDYRHYSLVCLFIGIIGGIQKGMRQRCFREEWVGRVNPLTAEEDQRASTCAFADGSYIGSSNDGRFPAGEENSPSHF